MPPPRECVACQRVRTIRARGVCGSCYNRLSKPGNTLPGYGSWHKTLKDRILENTDRSGECWLWLKSKYLSGYGVIAINSRATPAHRVSYQEFIGPIPEGLQLDHLCRVRHCVNPEHLEPVTQRENILRAPYTAIDLQREKTHCPQGHSYIGENLYIAPKTGGRGCRVCRSSHASRYRQKMKMMGN